MIQGQIRVLHIDDETDFTDLCATVLEHEDEQLAVETATSADGGMERISDRPPDCVVSDYNMPGRNGIEFLRAVREKYPHLPFILFTGKGSEEIASEAISAGVTDYLQKRGGSDQYIVLANRITNAVEQYRAKQRLRERERELERQNRRLYALFESFPEPTLAYVYEDQEPHVAFVNESFTEVFGYGTEEAVGEHVDDLIVPPDHQEEANEIDERVKAGETLDTELRRQARDGDRDFLFRNIPLTDDDEIDGYAIYTDVTSTKERERELQRQREQLKQREEKLVRLRDYTQELMYAGTPTKTATIALTAVDDILGFNLGAVFTQSASQDGVLELVEVLNQRRMEKMYGGLPVFLRDAPVGTHSALAWEVFEAGEPVWINDTAESERLPRKSPFGSLMIYPIGQHGVILLAATRLEAFTETEELLLDLLAAALETAFDRLEREHDLRRQRDELQRQNERLEQFGSVLSHDLRNPLNVATARLELASDECDSDHLDDVDRALDRMGRLIEDLRTLAREGKPVTDLEPIALSEMCEVCWRTVQTGPATLVVDTGLTVQADRSRLKQLFENLFRNAVEHSSTTQSHAPGDADKHGDTDVTITVGEMEDGFFIADDGPGIPDQDRGDIFEAGYSTSEDGTGFGLAIVEEIADTHGWVVRVAESADGGARFEIAGVESEE